jgi:large subunit ribosomal protein L10
MASPDKVEAVRQLTDRIRESSAVVFTEYRGLTVRQIGELRTVLDGHATFSVVKNTLTRRAADGAGMTVDEALLKGPSALAFVTGDAVVVAKGLRDFAKANPALIVKAAVLDGRSLSAGEVAKLADLESREVLLSKLAGAFNALPQRAVSLLAAPLSQAVRLVDALRAQVAANAPAEAPQQATADSETAEVAEVVAEDQSSPDAGIEPTTEPAPAGE